MRKIILIFIAALAAAVLPAFGARADGDFAEYTVIRRAYYGPDNRIYVAIRSFKNKSNRPEESFLIVDAENFKTSVSNTLPEKFKPVQDDLLMKTRYMKAAIKYNKDRDGYENHGMISSERKNAGMVVTADLCPSKKPLEKELFQTLASIMPQKTAPAPISLAISGGWIKKHGQELDWIKKEISEGAIDVTWINHSLTHPYDPKKTIDDNFLLMSGVNAEKEILDNEILMLKNGIIPSPFFRFPGLASDTRLLKLLEKFSLIPIGSDAWFAKHEYPKPGSIILLHANGNEPEGILMFSVYAKKNSSAFKSGSLRIMPLSEAFGK